MAITKATAMVLHSRKQGETSKILQLYSAEFGKISVMVKGSRGLKGKYWGTLEPLNHISVVFYYKPNRDLHYISQADLINRFPDIHKQLGKLALAAIACEIVNRGEEKEHPNKQLFSYLLQTLSALNDNDSGLKNFIRTFVLKYLIISGFKPHFESCSVCGTLLKTDCLFSLDHGSAICSKCNSPAFHYCIKTSPQVLQFLEYLTTVEIKKANNRIANRQLGDDIDYLLFLYLKYHIEPMAHLKSLNYLEKLKFSISDSG